MSIKSSLKTLATLGKGVIVGLPEAAEDRDPVALFTEWLAAAGESGLFLPESMSLATATPAGEPSVRMVLLKQVDELGFVFYTNYASRKAEELDANPRAALCFHWPVLERQVRVAGTVERLGADESAAYFATRPRGSQLGAWASCQSAPLASHDELEKRFREYKERFRGEEIPLPELWGGYRLHPLRIEFWQGKADRLHERLEFVRSEDGWTPRRLQP